MKLFALILTLGLSLQAFAAHRGLSPVRKSGETYQQARDRHLFNWNFKIPSPFPSPFDDHQEEMSFGSPVDRYKKPLKNLDLSEIPDVGSYADLEREFKYVRDTRFLQTEDPSFPRRLTWMYPDDGCYARAEMAKIGLVEHNFPAPKKIFVFGNLHAITKNSPTGDVMWWYHVAVTYRVGNEAYVFDPAIEPSRPLKLTEWNDKVGGSRSNVQYTICHKDTFDPSQDCVKPHALTEKEAVSEQVSFLEYEWDRVKELGRDPYKELGEFPPWSVAH
ncbi:hypothetical protein AZI85_02410 [Bdellovibrio bacteriovorus]|uniref:Protein glutaminase domain-containing protein n=1 Tax=Bdellovibrio bacteriovorus TaxID=959 RepID=A0A150WWY1_BDEBC|nr:protein-glutamine glutaminase family protein [Bdellovibrio bacteriovorus]KYG70802.1 hypothetical protein AZI85_02410 [Bdellovibrio bacteriovorus]